MNIDHARVIQVVETTLTRRGDGKNDPIRVVTQYWTLDGEMLAEVDLRGEITLEMSLSADERSRLDSCPPGCTKPRHHVGAHMTLIP